MYAYITRRLLMLIPVLFGVSIFIFVMMRVVPGDVAMTILGTDATPESLAQLRKEFGLNLPLHQQYLNWMGGVLSGDFGESMRSGQAVLPDILSRFTITFELTLLSALISWIIAIPMGIIAAIRHNTKTDFSVRMVSLLGVSVPNFAMATVLILVLALFFSYSPPVGYIGFFEDPLRNLQILILPSLVLGTGMAGAVMRMTRSSVLEILRQDFIRTIRAKGARERVIIFDHALRNAMIPILTIIGMQVGTLLGGAVIIEQIFSLPGLGQLVLTAITQRDFTVVQGSVLFIAFVFVMINLLVDVLYSYLDPRINYK
ncbi:ABC transporter permease [Peribacillus psychrosaccharolyticus]|uniref:ABC transporter permease n=2 Tax=Peribacillus psychrosaccharolyticus TaxID=1407 RepID=A0A974NRY1_PERPY|nr:ABC transporter permease [Peribacillus psychrosaccharolyticus]MEC2054471.1 ABC transporter permease [Peribacillus psychrosaccharolyticus]MED3744302.1 ABC transporter permease [Peribacillus psychrosaccharolyticus]QQT02761.1 ABC transporter permease [Peribacillus psychrosaccharolyticus]